MFVVHFGDLLRTANMKLSADLLGFIKTERMTLKVAGFYPLRGNEYKNQHALSATFFLNITILYVILASVYAFLNLTDITELSETVTFLMTELAYIGKILNVFFYRRNLILLEDMLQNPIVTELETDEEEIILRRNLAWSRLFTNIFKIKSVTAASVHAIYPLFGNSGSKNFIFLLWLPFDPKNYYVPVYFCEIILLFSSTLFDITLDSLNILMMDLCATQFEILKNRVRRISSNFVGGEAIDDRIRLKKLKKYVIHHNYIYSCSELVRETYSVGEFCQVGCSVMVVCFGLFKVIITPLKSVQFLMLITYSTTMIYQVSLYCCYGQKLLNANNTVTEACYMSKWNDCGVEVQKYLVMIMNRANTPFVMKAGGIFSLTLETLMTIFTSSYSFFAILWQVFNADE